MKLTRQQSNCLTAAANTDNKPVASNWWGVNTVAALLKLGLLEKVPATRGMFRITDKGRAVQTGKDMP